MDQSYAKAVEWYRKAAEQGNATAQTNLGYMYAEGRGVDQSYAKAVEWYRKAAEQGDALAQNKLGYMYAEGQGVDQSYADAYACFYVSGNMELVSSLTRPGLLLPAYCDAKCALAGLARIAELISAYPAVRSNLGEREGRVRKLEAKVASADRLKAFLFEIGLEEHYLSFVEQGITHDTVPDFTDNDLVAPLIASQRARALQTSPSRAAHAPRVRVTVAVSPKHLSQLKAISA